MQLLTVEGLTTVWYAPKVVLASTRRGLLIVETTEDVRVGDILSQDVIIATARNVQDAKNWCATHQDYLAHRSGARTSMPKTRKERDGE